MSDEAQGRKPAGGNNGANRYRNNKKKFVKAAQKKGGGNGTNQTKPKRRGECAELGGYIYFIGDARQADNYTKVTEAILNFIQRMYTMGNDVKLALERLT